MGAEFTIDSRTENPTEAVRTITCGGAHVSIDALGLEETCRNSVLCLRKLGRHIQLGHTTRKERGYVPLPIDFILLNELRLFGVFGMQGQRFGKMPSATWCRSQLNGPIAQWLEQGTHNALVPGSNPGEPTKPLLAQWTVVNRN